MAVAITRAVSAALEKCELTHLAREPIDVAKAQRQHETYEQILRSLGLEVMRATDEPEMADAVFVEDTAVVVEEVGVMTRPGAESRRGELTGVAEVLARYRTLAWIKEPGTLDGGDVLRVGRMVYVGLSSRTNAVGIDQLAEILKRFGYQVKGVAAKGCLHLKSAATVIADELLLINPSWIDRGVFERVDFVEVDAQEPYAANALRIAKVVVYGEQYPRTHERLEKRSLHVVGVDCGELAKAEGAVTCCSILVD